MAASNNNNKNQLTDRQKEEIKGAFEMFDTDGSGAISVDELGKALSALGQQYTTAELQKMIAAVDNDQNGEIQLDEFMNLMASRMSPADAEKELREAFIMFDSDGSGFIDAKELQGVMEKLGQPMNMDEIKQMLDDADDDGDGLISFQEFKEMMS